MPIGRLVPMLLMVVAVVAAGCGGQGSSGNCVALGCGGLAPSSSGGAAPSATASDQLIVVTEEAVSTPHAVRIVRPDGTQVQQLQLKGGASATRAAGSRIFVIEDQGVLKAVHKDGSVEDLGNLGSASLYGFVASPDGTRWMWGTLDGNHGQVHMAGDGMAPRVIAESNDNARSIQPFSWTSVGAFLHDSPVGIGGYILFNPALGPVRRVDLANLTTSPVARTDGCSFSDMAADGTIACFPNGASKSLALMKPDGKTTVIPLAQPRFALFGDAFFSHDGKQVTVGGAIGDHNQEKYATDLVMTKDGSITRLTLDGVRPSGPMQAQTWLDDGSLVVWRPHGAAGGPAGVFVVSPSGAARQVTQEGGTPIGLLAG